MIGDYYTNSDKDICKVLRVYENEVMGQGNDVLDYTDNPIPIQLTTEILKKNGFKDYTEIFEYQFEEDGEKYKFYLKKMYNKNNEQVCWGTNIGGVLPSLITYVHELQHALKICGLGDLADNFKVEYENN